MKTAIPGYPRIGKKRELKKAVEGYLEGSLPPSGLEAAAKALRLESWLEMKGAGIDFIPSNDFSLFDNMLDAAILFGLVPPEYKDAKLSGTDTMFAMARGRPGTGSGDLKALPMRKWFNTNYHFIVPRIDEGMVPALMGSKPIAEFLEARQAGVETRTALIGPFSFLRLSRLTGGLSAESLAAPLADAYASLCHALGAVGASWMQVDEPCLATDLSPAETALFESIYARLLPGKGRLALHLNIPFGSPSDRFERVIGLGFESIGLDFVEGADNLSLLRRHGFPRGTALVAGIVNGKNVRRADRRALLGLIGQIAAASGKDLGGEEFGIGTSCSLLHVPLSLDGENAMAADTKGRLSFAREKLIELRALADAASGGELPADAAGAGLPSVFAGPLRDEAVRARTAALRESDFRRLPGRAERKAIQREALALPPLPATTIGSFPQTEAVRALRAAYRKGSLAPEGYEAGIRKMVADCVKAQEDLGLDVLVHGEFERTDMAEFFAQRLKGFEITANGWVQSYGTRCVKPPIVVSDVSRPGPMTVDLAAYAQSLSAKPVKGMLTGPVTILNWSFPREDISLGECALQIALAIRDEALDLEKAGIGIIQIDEAALREKMPLRRAERRAYFDWAIPAFRLSHAALSARTQVHTHMCYSEFEDILAEIEAMDADVATFEASRSDYGLLGALSRAGFETAVGPGVFDIHSPRVPGADEMEKAILAMAERLGKRGPGFDGLWVNPDCGLKTRRPEEAMASLANMAEAARRVRHARRG